VIPAGYHDGAAVAARLRGLPGARVEVAGRGAGGGEVLAVTLGRGGPASAILAGLHPIEWIGVEAALALLERLAADPPRDRRVVALPLVNVDGHAAVAADLRAGRRRWRRGNPAGVDLNRNFPVSWRRRRRLPTGWNWGGHGPADQPEVAAVIATLGAAGVDRAVSLHSIGRKLLLPWGARWQRPPRWRELAAAAATIRARLPEPYDVRQIARWVPGAFAHGTELDWLHGELGALAILVECTLGGARVRDPATWRSPFAWFNPPDPARHAAAIAAALEPFLRAVAPSHAG
jgi:predicted deacylase